MNHINILSAWKVWKKYALKSHGKVYIYIYIYIYTNIYIYIYTNICIYIYTYIFIYIYIYIYIYNNDKKQTIFPTSFSRGRSQGICRIWNLQVLKNIWRRFTTDVSYFRPYAETKNNRGERNKLLKLVVDSKGYVLNCMGYTFLYDDYF